jgi:hypothetical protein
MSTLYGRTPSTTYPELLKLNHDGGGLDTILRDVEDGDGQPSPLKLAVDKISLHGQIWPSSGSQTGKVLKVTSSANTLEWGTVSTNEIDENPLNLFFTTSRARSAISASGAITYNSTTGVITTNATTLAGYGITDALTKSQPLDGGDF